MGRYRGSVCRLCRREGMKLFLKGERCYTPKCAFERRPYPPGIHGQANRFRRKQSDYALQLREKQKVKRIYGVLERQFRNYFKEASRRKGLTGTMLLSILESRLDNVVYRLGFADSRAQARQLVRHGHFEVNGRKVDIPSYRVKPGDIIRVREKSRKNAFFRDRAELLAERQIPDWLELDIENMTGRVLARPQRHHIDMPINEQLIVEYYSR